MTGRWSAVWAISLMRWLDRNTEPPWPPASAQLSIASGRHGGFDGDLDSVALARATDTRLSRRTERRVTTQTFLTARNRSKPTVLRGVGNLATLALSTCEKIFQLARRPGCCFAGIAISLSLGRAVTSSNLPFCRICLRCHRTWSCGHASLVIERHFVRFAPAGRHDSRPGRGQQSEAAPRADECGGRPLRPSPGGSPRGSREGGLRTRQAQARQTRDRAPHDRGRD